jgi:aminopeptidase
MGQSTLRWQKTRWCLVRVPNAAFAQQAQTDEETITEMFFNACLLDWPKESARWREWAGRLDGSKRVRVTGRHTDLSFSVQGRKWFSWEAEQHARRGDHTAPGGQPEGRSFRVPGVLSGRSSATSALEAGRLLEPLFNHQDFCKRCWAPTPGPESWGVCHGTNPAVDRFCNDILIDEKIGGTVHIAFGRSYPQCGGHNTSAIHWDIVKDLRAEGLVEVDGTTVLEHGRFLF